MSQVDRSERSMTIENALSKAEEEVNPLLSAQETQKMATFVVCPDSSNWSERALRLMKAIE